MRIIQLQLYLLVCCGAAEGSPDMLVDLGRTVTLQCEVAVKDVLWFLMKPSEPPVFILRSFSSKTLDSHYSNQTFSKTFSVQYNSSLFIHNISTNELGVYYCIQTPTGSPPKISHGIRLYIQNHSADTHQSCHISHNKTHDNPVVSCQCSNLLFISAIINCALAILFTDNSTSKETHHQNQTQVNESDKCGVNFWRSLFFTLGILNCLVLVVVTVRLCRKRSTNHQARPPNPGIRIQQENNIHIYDVVLNSPPDRSIGMNMLSSTYALLQPARPPS